MEGGGGHYSRLKKQIKSQAQEEIAHLFHTVKVLYLKKPSVQKEMSKKLEKYVIFFKIRAKGITF